MHLYGETLKRYVARALPEPTLAAIDAHVTNCMFCTHTLAETRAATTRWERRGLLGRLVRVPSETSSEVGGAEVLDRAA